MERIVRNFYPDLEEEVKKEEENLEKIEIQDGWCMKFVRIREETWL